MTKKTEELVVLPEIKYLVTEDSIKAFVDKHKAITKLAPEVGIKDPAYKLIRKSHLEAVSMRTGIEKTRKVIVAPALAFSKKVNNLAKEYTEMLTDTETLLFTERHKVEVYEQEQEQKRITAERERVEAIGTEITRLREIPLTVMGKSAEEIEKIYDSIPVPTIEIYQERHDEAITVYKDSMEKLENQILTMRKSEQADIIIAEEKVKADEAKARVDAEIKADREQFEKEKAELAKEREDLDREKREKLEEENRKKAEAEAEEMAESERIAEEANIEQRVATAKAHDKAIMDKEAEAVKALEAIIKDKYDSTPKHIAESILSSIIGEEIAYIEWTL